MARDFKYRFKGKQMIIILLGEMMFAFQEKYKGFHQQMLTADSEAIEFYKSLGFEKAGKTESMWVYSGTEH